MIQAIDGSFNCCEGLNGRFNSLHNILVSLDAKGPFGSPFVDSKRTAVTENTVEALQVFYLRPSLSIENSNALLEAAGKMFSQVHGGDFTTGLLFKDQQSFEI
ncbi:hypothetical protein [Viridibacillus sp. FSL E2-0187]|uniref:hypothetical protein n=1 Tax=Viridibacillus sp. FSL E2-0187 TaxID=2921362 RepID=UPI0040486551